MRKQSTHIVKLFDPNKDPSVAEALKAEQARDPSVTAVLAEGKFGLVRTEKGTFGLTDEGEGSRTPLEKRGIAIPFTRDTGTAFECTPFATATYSLADCEACLTGEEQRLDEFIRSFGDRLDRNFEAWERALSQ